MNEWNKQLFQAKYSLILSYFVLSERKKQLTENILLTAITIITPSNYNVLIILFYLLNKNNNIYIIYCGHKIKKEEVCVPIFNEENLVMMKIVAKEP